MRKAAGKVRTPKTTVEAWIKAARNALIEDGVAEVKIDRLAQQLGVTRGGFYHNFVDRDDLLAHLLAEWEQSNVFVAEKPVPRSKPEALAMLDALVDRLISEDGYDSRFDLAVRAWGHSDERAARAVERVDARRTSTLTKMFKALGCNGPEAEIRARVFYFHQIGYYSIGVKQSIAERRRLAPVYLKILIGSEHLDGSGPTTGSPREPVTLPTAARASR